MHIYIYMKFQYSVEWGNSWIRFLCVCGGVFMHLCVPVCMHMRICARESQQTTWTVFLRRRYSSSFLFVLVRSLTGWEHAQGGWKASQPWGYLHPTSPEIVSTHTATPLTSKVSSKDQTEVLMHARQALQGLSHVLAFLHVLKKKKEQFFLFELYFFKKKSLKLCIYFSTTCINHFQNQVSHIGMLDTICWIQARKIHVRERRIHIHMHVYVV